MGRINIFKTSIFLKAIYRFQFNPYQNFNVVVHRNGTNPKTCKETQISQTAQAILRKNYKAADIILLISKYITKL